MPKSIDLLRSLVRDAEVRLRADQFKGQLAQANNRLRAAETASRAALERWQETKRLRQPQLAEVAAEAEELGPLERKLAELIVQMAPPEREAAQQTLLQARAETEERRRAATEALAAAAQAEEEARRELQAARESLEVVARECQKLFPQGIPELADAAKLVDNTALLLPDGQMRQLAEEVNSSGRHFDVLSQPEQFAQVKVWIGRLRRLQSAALSKELSDLGETIFKQLAEISKTHQPGFIEAFNRGFGADWDKYIQEAEEELQRAFDLRHHNHDRLRQQAERQRLEDEKTSRRREASQAVFEELKTVVGNCNLPAEGQDQFRSVLSRLLPLRGASDPELLKLVLPYQELITEGSEFRPLRRHLEKLQQAERDTDPERWTAYADVIAATRGQKALMIGGAVREESRRQLLRVFEFAELQWENHEGMRPAALDSLEQRVRNRSLDLVLLLRNFIGHGVSDRLRPLCDQIGIPCLFVDHGYGAQQIADALRRGLVRFENVENEATASR